MKHDDYFLNWAYEIAKSAEPHGNQRMAAIIVIKRKVISIGINSGKTHPMATRFARDYKSDILTTPHAEVRAIFNASKVIDLSDFRKATLYIARAKKECKNGPDVWGMAKPCNGCERCIESFGIRKVIYTED